MSKIEEFFLEMEALFLPLDIEAFYEMKEDLLEHIRVQQESGKSEDEILESLGTPHEIVDEFYEEQRIQTALNAKKDVIPLEDVRRIYKNERARIRKKYFKFVIRTLKNIAITLISILIVYFIVYVIYEAIVEKHAAFTPILITSLLIGIIVSLLRKENILNVGKVFFWFGIIGFTWLTATNRWFYQGIKYNKTIGLPTNNEFTMKIHTDYPIRVVTVQVTKGQEARMEVKGYFKSSSIRHLNEEIENRQDQDHTVNLNLGTNSIFDIFTRMEKAELVLYLPEDKKVKDFRLDIKDGTIKIVHLDADNLDVFIEKGEFHVIDINANKITVQTKKADIIVNEYYSVFDIHNRLGKTIIKSGEGNLNLVSEKGYINVENITSNQANIKSIHGKIDIQNTAIKEFIINNEIGNTVIENQIGSTSIDSLQGEIIVRDLQNRLRINSDSSRIVVNQENEIEGVITSNSGIVKWIQSADAPLDFTVENEKGQTENAFAGMDKDNKKKVSIRSKSADVMIICKNQHNN